MSEDISEDDGVSQRSTFDSQMVELRRWPYVTEAVNNTLDQRLIEGRGRQFLYQALSNGNLMAFVGSGVSAGYGRLSWDNWLKEQFRQITNHADCYASTADKTLEWLKKLQKLVVTLVEKLEAIESTEVNEDELRIEINRLRQLSGDVTARYHMIGLQRKRISQIYDTFKSAESEGGRGLGGELPPIRFQIAEQLHDLLRSSRATLDLEGAREVFFKNLAKMNSEKEANGLIYKWMTGTDGARTKEGLKEANAKSLLEDISSGAPDLKFALDAYADLSREQEQRVAFQLNAKRLLVDEVAAARLYLTKGFGLSPDELGLEELDELPESKTLRRDFLLMRDSDGAKRYNVLRYFRSEAVKHLAESVQDSGYARDEWANIASSVAEECASNTPVGRKFASPTHRFMVEALASLIPRDDIARKWVKDNSIYTENTSEEINAFRKLDVSDYTSRKAIIDPPLDPLKKLVDELGVRQFLTTNYDFEIERLFTDRGYLRFEHPLDITDPDNLRINGSGGRFADLSFRPERSADLTTFALDKNEADAGVFHLHGRATEQSGLVVTERDYMNLYLRDDAFRDTSDEAIRLAFSACPILFVGLGMKEADVLRPLRQFMSDRRRDNQRWAFALLPADASKAEREGAAATLFIRYGVHSIYYGTCYIERPDHRQDDPPIPADFDWMHHVLNLLSHLKSVTKARMKIIEILLKDGEIKGDDLVQLKDVNKYWAKPEINPFANDTDPSKRVDALRRALGSFVFDGELEKNKERYCTAHQLLRGEIVKASQTGLIEPDESIWRGDFSSDAGIIAAPRKTSTDVDAIDKETKKSAPDDYLGFERRLLAELTKLELNRGSGLYPSVVEKLCYERTFFEPLEAHRSWLETAKRDHAARLAALDGLQDSIFTGTFAAMLDLIKADKDEWRAQWRSSPPHRQARFGLKSETALKEPLRKVRDPAQPLTYLRHGFDVVLADLNAAEKMDMPLTHAPDPIAPCSNDVSGKTLARSKPTGIRTFDDFISALQQSPIAGGMPHADLDRFAKCRRHFMVAADRGIGKGTFFAAFSSFSGLMQFTVSSWPKGVQEQQPRYLSAIFVNLGFSTEIASTFDGIIDALIDALAVSRLVKDGSSIAGAKEAARQFLVDRQTANSAAQIFGRWKSEILQEYAALARLAKLRVLLKVFADQNEDNRLRLLLVVNGSELYFTPAKHTKNGEIRCCNQVKMSFVVQSRNVPHGS